MSDLHKIIHRRFSKEKVLAANPTLIGIVAGIKFYEHPMKGDESPLIALMVDGSCGLTDYWELPSHWELTGEE